MSSYWAGATHPPRGADQAALEANAKTIAHRLMAMLWDLRWHDTREMIRAGRSHRFGAAVLVIRKEGWDLDTETYELPSGESSYRYRLKSHTPGPELGSLLRIYVDPADARSAAGGRLTMGMVRAARKALKS